MYYFMQSSSCHEHKSLLTFFPFPSYLRQTSSAVYYRIPRGSYSIALHSDSSPHRLDAIAEKDTFPFATDGRNTSA